MIENGEFVPTDWSKIVFSPVLWVRFPHMLLASYITGAFCVAASGAWYLLRQEYAAEARIMVRMGLGLAAVLVPVQLFFGHLNGEYVVHHQPSKMAAIEARWQDEKPASEVLLAWPDVANQRNLFAITLPPPFGSLIDSDSLTAGEVGMDSIPLQDRPPVIIPFFAFRIMVGCGLVMLLLAWVGSYLSLKGRIEQNRLLLWAISELSPAIHRHIDGLVHRRGRPSAMDGLWRPADRGLGDAISDNPRGDDLARCVLRGLRLHFLLRRSLHSPALARGTRGQPGSTAHRRDPQPSDVGGR